MRTRDETRYETRYEEQNLTSRNLLPPTSLCTPSSISLQILTHVTHEIQATGIECSDETVAFIKKWRRRDNKVAAVSFKIKDPKSMDATWVVDTQSTPVVDGKKVSAEDQFNEVRDSFKKYQNRVWLAKVEYEKDGADLSAIVYLLRRGQATKPSGADETKKQKRLRKMCFSTRMVYASSGAAIKSNVSTKHSEEYDHYDIEYADLATALAKKI